jgi:hypothetical protein
MRRTTELAGRQFVPNAYHFGDSYFLAGSFSRTFAEIGPYVSYEIETGAGQRFGSLHEEEVWLALYARWKYFPWNDYVRTTAAVLTGVNYASAIPQYHGHFAKVWLASLWAAPVGATRWVAGALVTLCGPPSRKLYDPLHYPQLARCRIEADNLWNREIGMACSARFTAGGVTDLEVTDRDGKPLKFEELSRRAADEATD